MPTIPPATPETAARDSAPYALMREGVLAFLQSLSNLSERFERASRGKAFVFWALLFWLAARWLWIDLTPWAAYHEENLYEFTAARNFLAHGFWATRFLPDYAAKGMGPVVYTHFPPLPSLLAALGHQIGFGPQSFRYLLALASVAGIYVFYKFLDAAFGRNAAVMGLFFSSTFFSEQFAWSGHTSYAFTLLVLFWPSCLLYRRPGFLNDGAIGGLVFFTSLLNYKLLIIQLFLLGMVSRHARGRVLRTIGTGMAAALLGLGLHLAQNIAFLGRDTAIRELAFTISNRILSIPSTADLEPWFRAHNIVLWGAPRHAPAALLRGILKNMILYPGLILLRNGFLSLLIPVAMGVRYFKKPLEAKNLRLLAGVFLSAGAWGVLFPAHELGYGLSSTESLGPLLAVCFLCGYLLDLSRTLPRSRAALFFLLAALPCAQSGLLFINQYTESLRQTSHPQMMLPGH